jgi:hypothetical protein
VRFEAKQSLDQRSALIDDARPNRRDLPGLSRAAVALSLRLSDGSVRWMPLIATGRLARLSRGADRTMYRIDDEWSVSLKRVLRSWWRLSSQGQAFGSSGPARLRVGSAANCATRACTVAGVACHVLMDKGLPWTIGKAITYVSACANLRLRLGQIPGAIASLELQREIDLSEPIGDVLEQLLKEGDLQICREFDRSEGGEEIRVVCAAGCGRIAALPRRAGSGAASQSLHSHTSAPSGAQHWVAQAPGRVVEFTAELVAGWDASLQGELDATYDKNASVAFALVRDVFRLWALNEDSHFCAPPFDRGPAFDLSLLFAQRIEPQRLQLENCLTLDPSGQRVEPIVEVSVDHGSTWSRYAGTVTIRTDRAAVYLDDATLTPEWIDAVRTNAARVRVTASMRCPVPVTVDRWTGNPFAGSAPEVVLQTAGVFESARVDDSSIHCTAIRSGALLAVESDPTPAMQRWLDTRVIGAGTSSSSLQRAASATRESTSIRLTGALPWLRIGDRIALPDEPGKTLAAITKFVCHWPDHLDSSTPPRTDVTIDHF